jgi:UDP-N-acetylmuramoyl-L-alanyl-D-glutamate--2,6-diaminopimelate ligase
MKGYTQDGHDFIGDAVSRGAAAILSEMAPDTLIQKFGDKSNQLPVFLQVSDSRKALSPRWPSAFYGHPFRAMNLIGITGTNGKTTTSYLLESILAAAGRNPGVIGTINHRISGSVLKSSVTTPESLDLMKILREMADPFRHGCDHGGLFTRAGSGASCGLSLSNGSLYQYFQGPPGLSSIHGRLFQSQKPFVYKP